MVENRMLESSFADAIAAIEQAKELPPSKRAHWSCSLRMIAKALDRPPESIAARWVAVALAVNQLHHANSGVEWKTLANHKANAKAALFWFRGEQGLPLRGAPLEPEWRKLRRRLKDRSRLAKLSGLIRYCSLKARTRRVCMTPDYSSAGSQGRADGAEGRSQREDDRRRGSPMSLRRRCGIDAD